MKALCVIMLVTIFAIALSGCSGIVLAEGTPATTFPAVSASQTSTAMPILPSPSATAKTQQSSYGKLKLLFSTAKDGRMQGLAFANGSYFVGYDMGNGNGRIIAYSTEGKALKTTGLLPTAHTAEVAYRDANRQLYISNGQSGASVRIYAVDIESQNPSVTRVIGPDIPGFGALVAIDNSRDVLVISTNSDMLKPGEAGVSAAEVLFCTCDFSGKVLSRCTIPYQGVPQGIECCNGFIYFYTDNKVTVLDESGMILQTYMLKQSGESEGMTLVSSGKTPVFAVGYNSPNRVLSLVLP